MGMEEAIRQNIGERYVNGTYASENGLFVDMCYRKIAEVNAELFARIPYEVIFTTDDVYPSAKVMRERVQAEGVIYIYTGSSGHPFLSTEENNVSRAVHDVFAHLVCGCPFTFQGEYNAYLTQRQHYPRWTWNVLFTEIPAQTAAYYYLGSFDYTQRAFISPTEWLEICEMHLTKDYSHDSVLQLA